MNKKNKIISTRFTSEESELILKQAKETGVKLSQFVRMMILKGKVVQRLSPQDADTLRKLSGMGNNLNQLAHKANAAGFLTVEKEVKSIKIKIVGLINKLSDDWKNK